METEVSPKDRNFADQARARVRKLHQGATELTEELGLPPEAKGTVLKGLHDPNPRAHAGADTATEPSPAIPEGADRPQK